jgi:hypothetical protein
MTIDAAANNLTFAQEDALANLTDHDDWRWGVTTVSFMLKLEINRNRITR